MNMYVNMKQVAGWARIYERMHECFYTNLPCKNASFCVTLFSWVDKSLLLQTPLPPGKGDLKLLDNREMIPSN